jgi:predicted RNA-binding protein with PUA-like domain
MRTPGYEHPRGRYLLKTEPGTYGWDDLDRDGSTVWDGVRNYTALKHMREVRQGDLAFFYHTGDERRIVGIARITSDAYPDPRGDSPAVVAFDLEPLERLERPVELSAIRADPAFEGFDLVRLPRLSVMPVSPVHWDRVLELSRG